MAESFPADEEDKRVKSAMLGSSVRFTGPAASLDASRILGLVEQRVSRGNIDSRLPRRRLPYAIAAVAVTVVGGFSVLRLTIPSQDTSTPSALTVKQVTVSLPFAYGSLAEIADASDVVAFAVVQEAIRTEPSSQPDGIPHTVYAVALEKVLRGKATDRVDVIQLGGQVGNVRYDVVEDSAMQPGDHLLLFLRSIDLGTSNTYAIVGGPQGRLRVEGNLLVPVSDDVHVPIPDDLTMAEAEKLISP